MPSSSFAFAGRHAAPLLALAAAAAAGACARPPAPPPEPAPPPVNAPRTALALEAHTALTEPIRVVFGWQLNESGTHVKGRGVARIEPPYRARLDLFLNNGETVVRAALVDGDLRLPPGAPTDLLPPPDLMWSVLGVFRPGTDAALVGAERVDGGGVLLHYRYGDGRGLDVRVVEQSVRRLEVLDRGGHTVERVELGFDGSGRYPEEATYRDLSAFRELKLTRESVERVEPYPPDIWNPNGTKR